ncbi:unnamed protein product [Symbiodinium natans]|uniref:Uncharacterized protein n=1 Tax=Symbiodinium natans TaxID=878477 RepID=A0A812P6A6_9DINO|nr:unnamed protein product [Symbiodinium natans]
MAFRQMLRGVCDGDVLLDDDLNLAKTCGDVSALKRILGTHGDLKGRKFQDFLVQQEEAILTFETFVANAVATGEASGPPPKCLRVLLQTEGPREIPVDVFHVALPDLYGTNATYHLLAISEDAESHLARSQSQGAPRANSDSVEFYNELSELTLLLNASTTDIDIEEATVHFARKKAAKHDTGWGMPTLRKLIRPLDWQALEAQIRIVARDAKLHRGRKGKSLPELMLRLPGAAEPKTYLRARSASVERVYSGMLAPGEPTYLYLQLGKFNQGRRGLGTDKRRLEGVEEDCANETKDV